MKKYLAFVLAVATFIFICPFSVSAGAEEEWNQKLDLSDSVSSSVIKLDDGIVVMQYEGGSSDNNVLKKYDFDGNEIWSIKNEYGYEMGALGDGFIVFTVGLDENLMTKISSQGEIVWTKKLTGGIYGYAFFLELDSGFIIYGDFGICRFDNNGNLLKEISKNEICDDVYKSGYRGNMAFNDFAVTLSTDGENILVYVEAYQNITGGTSGYYHAVAQYSLNLDYLSSNLVFGDYYIYLTKILETENNYIIFGNGKTLVFNKKGQIDRVLNIALLDAQYIDGYIYGYVFKEAETYKDYNTYIVKYDENLMKIDEYQLPTVFSISGTTNSDFINNTSGFAFLKNRSFFYKDSSGIHFVYLDSSITNGYLHQNYADSLNSSYGILQYKLNDDKSDSPVTDDGIIDNIFENPETSSVVVIITFVVLVLIGGLGFYLGYKKKVKSE